VEEIINTEQEIALFKQNSIADEQELAIKGEIFSSDEGFHVNVDDLSSEEQEINDEDDEFIGSEHPTTPDVMTPLADDRFTPTSPSSYIPYSPSFDNSESAENSLHLNNTASPPDELSGSIATKYIPTSPSSYITCPLPVDTPESPDDLLYTNNAASPAEELSGPITNRYVDSRGEREVSFSSADDSLAGSLIWDSESDHKAVDESFSSLDSGLSELEEEKDLCSPSQGRKQSKASPISIPVSPKAGRFIRRFSLRLRHSGCSTILKLQSKVAQLKSKKQRLQAKDTKVATAELLKEDIETKIENARLREHNQELLNTVEVLQAQRDVLMKRVEAVNLNVAVSQTRSRKLARSLKKATSSLAAEQSQWALKMAERNAEIQEANAAQIKTAAQLSATITQNQKLEAELTDAMDQVDELIAAKAAPERQLAEEVDKNTRLEIQLLQTIEGTTPGDPKYEQQEVETSLELLEAPNKWTRACPVRILRWNRPVLTGQLELQPLEHKRVRFDEADDTCAGEGRLRAKIMKRPGKALEDWGSCHFEEASGEKLRGRRRRSKFASIPWLIKSSSLPRRGILTF
jgi:hypothetical protein